jgi:hypothetical protein
MPETTISPEGITQSYDEFSADFRKKQTKDKWTDKEELKVARNIWDRFGVMETNMKTCSPFVWPADAETDISDTEAMGGGMIGGQGSQFDYLDRCEKQWSMIRLIRDDSVELRSATTFAPVEAAMADFQKGDIVAIIEPGEYEEDIVKAKLINFAHDHLYYKKSSQIKRTDRETFHDCLKFGYSWRYVGWFNTKQEMTFLEESKTLLKGADKDKRKEIEEKLKSGKPIERTETNTVYDDIGHARVSPYEIYHDPDARYMRHHVYSMRDIIWRQTPTVDGALAEFKNSNDPYVVKSNVDKIVSAKQAYDAYGDSNKPFFRLPTDIQENDQVVLLRYYNKFTDKYIVLVNDVVLRDGPLPYDHKELPFVLHKLVEWEGHLFGFGIAAAVEGLQSEDEELRSLFMEQLKITIAPPLFYNKMIGEDLDAWERYQAGEMIGVSGPVDDSMMRWLPGNGGNMSWFNARQDLAQMRTELTGIDPITSSAPRQDEAVRTHMMSLEATQKIISKHIQNWGEPREEATWMDIHLMRQFYPLSYIETIDGKGETKTKYKVVKTKGTKIEVKMEAGKLDLKTEKSDYGFFEMKNEYMDLMGEVDIRLNLDQIQRPSRSALMANSRDMLATLVPIYSNPQMLESPGISDLIHWVGELHNVPPNVLEQLRDESNNANVELARMQNQMLSTGEKIPGIPGQSFKHIQEHIELLNALFTHKQELETKRQKKLEPKQQAMEQMQLDPMMMEQMNMVMATEVENFDIKISKVDELIANISEHIQDDQGAKSASAQIAVQRAMPPAPQPPMPPPGMDPAMMMGGVPPEAMMQGSMGQMGAPPMDPAMMMAPGMPPGMM